MVTAFAMDIVAVLLLVEHILLSFLDTKSRFRLFRCLFSRKCKQIKWERGTNASDAKLKFSRLYNNDNYCYETLIYYAAEFGYTSCVVYLCYTLPNTKNDISMLSSALEFAANNGHTSCVRFLLKFGAQITKNTFAYVESNKTMASLRLLLKYNMQLSYNAMELIISENMLGCLRSLIAHGVEIPDNSLMIAITDNMLACFRWLLKCGVPVTYDVINYASVNWRARHLKVLMRYKGDIRINSTLMENAAEGGSLQCLRILYYAGGKITQGVLDVASKCGHVDCVEFCKEILFKN